MSKFKSQTIAVSKTAMYLLSNAKSLRTVKAFLFPYTQIYWGNKDGDTYTNRKTSKIYIDIETFAEAMGYSMTNRIITEIRKIYRIMNQELFEDENSPDIYFSYDSQSKDKKYFILKVHKPKEIFHMSENTTFVCMAADDVFRCQSIYDYKILALIASAPETGGARFRQKEIELSTYFLKYYILKMGLYKNCYINKNNPQYNQELLDYFEYYFKENWSGNISDDDFVNEIEKYAISKGYDSPESVIKQFKELVTFNKRTRIEDYLSHALELINQGTMFQVRCDRKTGKLFKKTKRQGYRVDKYIISVWQHYKV